MVSGVDYTGGLLPPDFLAFIQFSAVMGFIASLVLATAIIYKVLEKVIGEKEAKKYRWIFVIADVAILLIFIFIYLIVF